MFGVLHPAQPEAENVPLPPPPPPNSLAPLPESDFDSRDALLETAKAWAADQGYAVVIARSRFNRMWLKCDRGGSYENRRNITANERKRKRGESRLLGCPFRMICSNRKNGKWHVEIDNPSHNHEPSTDLTSHPTLRRLTPEQLQKVHEMCDNGNTPAETIDELRQIWPNIKILTRDIYNARKKHKNLKDAAEAEASLPPQPPPPDPNGIVPGLDERGRWAWVPDGEEVTRKGRRRRRQTAPQPQENLDPQLSTPGRGIPQREALSTGGQQHLINQLSHAMESPSMIDLGRYGAAEATNTGSLRSTQAIDDASSRLRSSLQSSPSFQTSSQFSPQSNRAAAALEQSQDPQVLQARIERMEQQQQETKNILNAILGAVQGKNGPLASGAG